MTLTEAHCLQCTVKDTSGHLRIPGVATGSLETPPVPDAQSACALGEPASAEDRTPVGQALLWYLDVLRYVPSARKGAAHAVARQLARLCGDDSQVGHLTWRSLADAVGEYDDLGRTRAFVEAGVQVLEEQGWLERETVGRKRGAVTTWRLTVGPVVLEATDQPLAA